MGINRDKYHFTGTHNPLVVGSSPTRPTIYSKAYVKNREPFSFVGHSRGICLFTLNRWVKATYETGQKLSALDPTGQNLGLPP